jgi:hypothetical protein
MSAFYKHNRAALRMNLRRKFLLLSLLLFTISGSSAQDVGVLHLRPLHLELPSTWSFDGSRNPIEGKGPQGEKLLISTMRRRVSAASEPAPSAKETAQGFAQGPMGDLASKGGKVVVRPVSEFPVQDGKAGYSAGSESSSVFGGKSYFIQYLLAAPGVIIYLTFEGKGEALPAMQRFDEFFKTQRWDE